MNAALWVAVFGGAAAGAVLNQIFGFLSGWIDRRHEHRSWLRANRLEAYSLFLAAGTTWTVAYVRAGDAGKVNDEMQAFVASGHRVKLLGPDKITEQVKQIIDVLLEITGSVEPGETNSVKRNSDRIAAISRGQFDLVQLAQIELQGPPRSWQRGHHSAKTG